MNFSYSSSKGKVGLVIDGSHCRLPAAHNEIFLLESYMAFLYDDIPRNNSKQFLINHSQSDVFLDKLGPENTFIFYRVILSFYDAAYQLGRFHRYKIEEIKEITIENIEQKLTEYDLSDFNNRSLTYANFLAIGRTGVRLDEIYSGKNETQELMWSMNLKAILNNYNIKFFENFNPNNKAFNLNENNYGYAVNKILHDRELSMVLHEWGKLNKYDKPDFLRVISNILEFIKSDFRRNKHGFKASTPEFLILNEQLDEWIEFVDYNKSKFFRIFNASDFLGFISRHGKKPLADFQKIRLENNADLSIKNIIKNMNKKIIPNQLELKYLFNFWHYVTSNIVLLWFRVRKSN